VAELQRENQRLRDQLLRATDYLKKIRATHPDLKPSAPNVKIWVEYEGERVPISHLAKRLGLSYQTLRNRLANGMTVEQAAKSPTRQHRKHHDNNATKPPA
jgi:hypothetical protein